MDEQQLLFEAVIDSISNDRFLLFVEQFTDALLRPLSPKFLQWCPEAAVDRHCTEGAVPPSSHDTMKATSAVATFTLAHHEAFQTYQLLFESRIQSVLKRTSNHRGELVSPEVFFNMCAATVARSKSSLDAEMDGLSVARSGTVEEKDLSVTDLCEALLDMVNNVSSFSLFSAMMAERQRSLILGNDEDEDDASPA